MAWEAERGSGPAIATPLLALAVTLAPAGLATVASGQVDEQAAAGFVEDAMWADQGTSVDFPGHVVYPADSLRVLEGLEATDAAHRAAPHAAARAAAANQQATGGVAPQKGNLLGPTTEATGAALALADRHGAALDEAAAVGFLEAMQNPDGGFAPRYSLGGGTLGSYVFSTYYAVLGLDAAGELDAVTRLEVRAFLAQAQNADGGWADPPGEDTSQVTATSYAVRTLDLLDLLDPATATRAAAFLEAAENPRTGGFEEEPYPPDCYACADEPASAPTTGRALVAVDRLTDAGAAPAVDLDAHADWLAERQIDEGPFAGAFPLFGDAPPNPAHEAVDGSGAAPPGLGAPFPPVGDVPVTDHSRNTALAVHGLALFDRADALELDPAQGFLAASQHPGTGGFGSHPGYLQTLPDTAAAHRALSTLDAAAPADALAVTLAAWQDADGHIERPTWDLEAKPAHTAQALVALGAAQRVDAIDASAAARVIVDAQAEDGHLALDRHGVDEEHRQAWLGVRALAAAGALDRLDTAALVDAIADAQRDDGALAATPAEPQATRETGAALRALTALGAADAVDLDAAVTRLADAQGDDGTFGDPATTSQAVLGLAAVDRLDAVDAGGARAALVDAQGDHGGFADPGFPTGPSPVERHALALEALAALGSV
jgi:prenyltransferase beta subunit